MEKEYKPQVINGVDSVFGGDMKKLLPPMNDIPEEFQRARTEWNKLVSQWFFKGLKSFDCEPKEGIDKAAAMKHVGAILRSWEPSHEHKEAGCAYLLSIWFKEPKYTVKV
jgi:hypothetical protein